MVWEKQPPPWGRGCAWRGRRDAVYAGVRPGAQRRCPGRGDTALDPQSAQRTRTLTVTVVQQPTIPVPGTRKAPNHLTG